MDYGIENDGRNPTLPLEVITYILARLPCKSLMRFRCVCKAWHSLFASHFFFDLHEELCPKSPGIIYSIHEQPQRTGFYLVEDDQRVQEEDFLFDFPVGESMIGMLPPARGLLCLIDSPFCYPPSPLDPQIYVYNPIVEECTTLPRLRAISSFSSYYGFAYHPVTKRYSVVRMGGPSTDCLVFDLGYDECWRSIGNAPYVPWENCYAVINGVMYWYVDCEYHTATSVYIFSLDTGDETFRVVPHPSVLSAANLWRSHLTDLQGSLSIVHNLPQELGFEIWTLNAAAEKEVWIKEQKIIIPPELLPVSDGDDSDFSIVGIQNGELVIHGDTKSVTRYDLQTKMFRNVEIVADPQLITYSYLYTDCLELYL